MKEADTQAPKASAIPASRPAVVVPLAPERYKIQFTASQETYEKLRRAQELLRHTIPDGDPAAVFDRAIPAAVRREVWRRDGARCAFVGPQGRCAERGFLELHHIVPFAKGGAATVANIALRCRAHNAYEAEEHFGSFVLREQRAEYASVPDRVGDWHQIGASPRPVYERVASVSRLKPNF